MDLISRERLVEQVQDILDKWEFFYGQRAGRELWIEKPKEVQDKDIADFCRDLNIVRSATIDAVPVVHGENLNAKWPSLFECSVCHWECWDSVPCDSETFNFCPNCGARMDGADMRKGGAE